MKKFSLTIFLIFLSAFLKTVYCQSTCPISTLKVNKVSGTVVDKMTPTTVLSKIKIEVRKTDDAETLVSTTTTDKDGLFEFNGIEKGKYIFIVDFGQLFSQYRAVIKVKESNSPKTKPSILVRFGGDCWETEIVKAK